MARISFDGYKEAENVLGRLSRGSIRRLVMAGAEAAADRMRRNITDRHRGTGEMLRSVGLTEYREDLDSGSVEVYPLGEDSRGQRNATKAYVINFGRYGKRGPRSGDRFITGDTKAAERAAYAAMHEENLRIIAEAKRGE